MTPETQALIERLAGEAGFDTDLNEITAPHALIDGDPMDVRKLLEKFAELVVSDLETFVYMDTNLYLAIGGDGIEAVATAIRQRFGVGE